jgi:hypothetical protein
MLAKKGMSGKSADIDVSVRHVADMSLTFPTKFVTDRVLVVVIHHQYRRDNEVGWGVQLVKRVGVIFRKLE